MSLQSEMLVEQKVSNAQKSTGTAYLLWFFLGGFGAHRFYLGKTGTAVTQLIITLIGCFTLFPLIITGIWWIVDAFLIPGIIQGRFRRLTAHQQIGYCERHVDRRGGL